MHSVTDLYTPVTHAPAQFMCVHVRYFFILCTCVCVCVYHYVCPLLYSIDEGQNIHYSTCVELSDTSVD